MVVVVIKETAAYAGLHGVQRNLWQPGRKHQYARAAVPQETRPDQTVPTTLFVLKAGSLAHVITKSQSPASSKTDPRPLTVSSTVSKTWQDTHLCAVSSRNMSRALTRADNANYAPSPDSASP